MNQPMADPNTTRRLRRLLFALTVILTFEGLARKMVPSEIGVALFFLKDFIVTTMAFYVWRMPMSPMIKSLWDGYAVLAVFMVPSIIMTAIHDPVLAVFGTKQYLLYPFVGFATFLALENLNWTEIFAFYRRIALLVLPTAILAAVQIRLPHDHWLNMTVNGDSLEGFGAGGEMRVSSTFSFVAQYSAFLNAEAFIVMVGLHGWARQKIVWKVILFLLVPAFVFGCFVTGSREAVVGNLAIILLALILGAIKFQLRSVFKIALVMALLYSMVLALKYFSPNSIAAYSARENGQLIGLSSEMQERILSSFFHGMGEKALGTFWGHGLGVMSNGSDQLSYYAAIWRSSFWTETDFSTTIFEGGYYLVVVWYGFRFYVILKTLRHFLKDVTPEFSVPVAFCQGFVMVIGTFGTLELQPPIAIWWWLGVGTVMLFSWKCTEPPESEIQREEPKPPAPLKKPRGRSLYADVIHPPK